MAKKMNWTPWLIGGAVVLGAAGAAYWYSQKKAQPAQIAEPPVAEAPTTAIVIPEATSQERRLAQETAEAAAELEAEKARTMAAYGGEYTPQPSTEGVHVGRITRSGRIQSGRIHASR